MEKRSKRELKEGYIIMAKEDAEAAEANLGAAEEALRWRHANEGRDMDGQFQSWQGE